MTSRSGSLHILAYSSRIALSHSFSTLPFSSKERLPLSEQPLSSDFLTVFYPLYHAFPRDDSLWVPLYSKLVFPGKTHRLSTAVFLLLEPRRKLWSLQPNYYYQSMVRGNYRIENFYIYFLEPLSLDFHQGHWVLFTTLFFFSAVGIV